MADKIKTTGSENKTTAPNEKSMESRIIKRIKKYDPFKYKRFIVVPILVLAIVILSFSIVFSIPDYANCQGIIEPLSYVPIYCYNPGKIKMSNFKDGIIVKKNDVLIEIDNTPLEIEFEKLKGDLEYQESNLYRMQLDYSFNNKFMDLKIRKQKESLDRSEKLLGIKGISKKQVDESLTEIELLELQTKMQRNQLLIKIDAVKKNIADIKSGIKQKEYLIENSKIIAPDNGKLIIYSDPRGTETFTKLDFSKGDHLNNAQLLGYVLKDNIYVAKIKIPENKIGKIKIGQHVKLYLNSYSYMEYKLLEFPLSEISLSAYKGFYTGMVELPKEMNRIKAKNKYIEIEKTIGTTLNAKIKLSNANFIAKILHL